MGKLVAMTGNIAVANAMRQINPDVCAAYPITPSTEVMQQFSSFVADGKVDTELVTVESEHSAMSACIGAAAAGGRVMTATSANGLALMWEMLYIASGNRLPMAMMVVNRALSAPINIHGDHSDEMGARDAGWIQLYAENAQEAYDNIIQAVVIGESEGVRLPVMTGMDGFIISHSIENLTMLEDQEVRSFLGDYVPYYPLLNIRQPITLGPLDLQDYYSEHKRQQNEAMMKAKGAIIKVARDFASLSGRNYGFFEPYRLEDAEIGILTLGSSAGTTRFVVDVMREKGVRVGMLKLRVFRPFPLEELQKALGHLKALAVMDRSDSFGAAGGPVFSEVRSALYDLPQHPRVVDYIYGLGGRDLGVSPLERVVGDLQEIKQTGTIKELVTYLTVRE
ncbi:MAG: pyruvate ferredoxin oxidoreductase [bacterium]